MKSSGGSGTNLDINTKRVKRPCLHIPKVLNLLLLLTGLASGKETSTTTPPHVTSAPTLAFYILDIAVDVTGPVKNESEITSWLQEVFQNSLGSCVSSQTENTTALPAQLQTVSANTSVGTTTAATTNGTQSNVTATAMLQSNNTTAATTTLQNSTTTATTTLQNSTTTMLQNTTTTATTALQNNTAAAASTLQNNNTTTVTTTLQNNNTTMTTTTLPISNTATAVQTFGTTAAITLQISDTNAVITVKGTPNDAGSNRAKITTNNAAKTAEKNIASSNNARFIRQAILSSKSSDLFQGMEVSCAKKTEIRKTNCFVILALRQSVAPCCILQTLCHQNSSDIHTRGKRANRLNPLNNNCSSDHLEENICIYTQDSTNSKCKAFGAPPCGAGKNKNCSCGAYCNGTDAYYTFEISIQDPEMSHTYPLTLISRLNQSCSPSTNGSCALSSTASKYKNATADCAQAGAIAQICRVILQLAEEAPICNVSAAITTVFRLEQNVTFDGRITRAAICGHLNVSGNLLDSQFTWINTTLEHAEFCAAQEDSPPLLSTQTCQSGENVVVQLKEQCVPAISPTASPNVTTTQPNTASSNTTSSPANATSAYPDVTTASPNETEIRANALLELTANVSRLNSSQVNELVSRLEDLLSGPNISLALANTSIHIVSNLLDASAETLASSSNRIIRIVDTVSLKMILEEETETLLSPALALSVKAVDGSDFQQVLFSISDPSNAQVRGDPRFRRDVRNDDSIPQGSITLPASLTQNLTSEEQQMASRVHFNFYQKSTLFQDRSLGIRRLNSGIIGASLADLTATGLQDEVMIRLRNLEPVPANYVATCVFWDFTLNDRSGGWNKNGCYVQNSTDNMTVCGCNHLTSFSILLDLAREPLTSRVQATILTFITYIGCGISAIFLALTLLTYLAFGKLRKDSPSKILIQLCVALLLLNLIFLVDAWLALYPDAVGLCISTAWFLHYFLLAAFTWMGLEAVHMYLALIKVFNSYVPYYMLRFSLAGWGVPMIVVVIVIAVDKDNYGLVSYGRFSDDTTDDFCWLNNDIAFFVAVVAYFCVIFLFNFIMFVVVLVQLHMIKRQNPHNSQHRSTGQNVRSVVGITILLGLTWGFAFFAWGPLNLPFMYLFAICNAFQGFFIFVFHCAMKDVVRRQWQTYLCFGKIRLAENSDWSSTAIQKRATSLSSPPSSRSNKSSSSSSFLSHNLRLTHGIGNPLEDRTITADEEPSLDGVLNDLNREHRNHQPPSRTHPHYT
ncbi:adhesion G-protein coupled receptor G2 isoform X3 [Phycodurus eques]|uniref:adhesion G-protein coupled receptor G2 isoform X3 n=1 Tax=Phycodurus eques TaxID=693459 RepID=UPI002ACE50F5|nr:adhesion G-protein coupled receptor G2 isoform X3 [Phycodurus eques]